MIAARGIGGKRKNDMLGRKNDVFQDME